MRECYEKDNEHEIAQVANLGVTDPPIQFRLPVTPRNADVCVADNHGFRKLEQLGIRKTNRVAALTHGSHGEHK